MKTMNIASAAFAFSVTTALAGGIIPQQNNEWFKAGEAEIQSKIAQQPITKPAKNIILLIADGNGVGTNYATRIFAGQQNGLYGDENVLPQEAFPNLGLVKTYNVNAQTPDSAGTGTAIHSGVKTKAGVLGVDETLNRGDCSQVEAAKVATIAEVLSNQGKSVGVVSTARLTHATPASAYAHSADRNFEDNSELPEGCETPDIVVQLIDQMKSGVVDLALGGGRRHFLPKSTVDEEGKNGKRTDDRNLIDEAKKSGISYVGSGPAFSELDLKSNAPILGLFGSSHMQYEHDRTDEPSLAEMVKASITALQDNESGYFLTVEAGRVDHANHDGNAYRALTDGVAFAEAIAMADTLTSDQDTLIIVTADHGHTISFNGYCGRGTPIHGLCMGIDNDGVKHTDEIQTMNDDKPYTVIGYMNGPGSILKEDQNWEAHALI